ncbi:hypothetical protein B0H13DRAFT_2337699 [Mycena leptocephala]|nr:hypothetical protein B0H13DRAFT_2337699 [Mycena leptocephala]
MPLSNTNSVLPAYTPSSVVPPYSPEPGHDERRLEHSPRRKVRTFSGHYIQKSGRDTVVLTAQDEHAEMPTYGRAGLIGGFVSVEDRDMVSEIILKVKGSIELMVSGDCVAKTILDEQYTLWSPEHSNGPCPSDVPFSTILPVCFQHKNATHPLPPSYFASHVGSGGLYAKVCYALAVTVTRARRRKLSFLASKNTTVVHFTYCPRTCPASPMPPPASDFLADVKVMPEEWYQVTLTVNPRPKVLLPALDLHVFTPASDAVALGEPIPVHIQLIGLVHALREFLPDPNAPGSRASSCIEVTLVRQMRLHVRGDVQPTRVITGRAVLHATPPSAVDMSWDGTNASLDWAGKLYSNPDIAVGSFDAAVLQVKDFIVVDVLEPAGVKSQFARTRHSRPIRLVSDLLPDS